MAKNRSVGRLIGRLAMGGLLVAAGYGHLGPNREGFQAAVPDWMPGDKDFHVVWSGIAELIIGVGLLSGKKKRLFGVLAAALMVIVFPGNVWMYQKGIDASLINSDARRLWRLSVQLILILLPLWATQEKKTDENSN